jgi:predicted secreted hydrolase
MRSSAAALLAVLLLCCTAGAQQAAPQYQEALPGYRYSFPRDHFSHPEFRTEWWYYTGNVKSADGRAFGFQVTFFRQGVQRTQPPDSPWAIEDLYLAHAALSDLSGGKFYHSERLNRAGPGIAGVNQETGRIWNGNWQTVWTGDRQKLDAVADEWSLHLTLNSQKPPVINGEQGISRKGAAPGEASHYISLTRLVAAGTIDLGGQAYTVEGMAWMDHEFFTNQLAPEQVGWDWLSVQLSDRTELMLFRLRRKDGSIDPFSAATYVDRDGRSQHLSSRDFSFTPLGGQWTSPATGASYPLRWRVSVPALSLNLEISTRLPQQEMTASGPVSPNYWEGAIEITGTRGTGAPANSTVASPVTGVGYLEMTGYDRPVHFGQ